MAQRIAGWPRSITLVFAITAGMAACLLLAQLLWSESANYRLQSYTSTLLRHAESVASNVSGAIAHLEKSRGEDCSGDDMAELRKTVFEFRYIKDAGRVLNGKLACSAVWGAFTQPYDLGTYSMSTRNGARLWLQTPSYSMPDRKIDITAREHAFAVTSPTAFAPFEDDSPEIAALITSSNMRIEMRRFGQFLAHGDDLTHRQYRKCSAVYDICVTAQIASNLFAPQRAPMLLLIGALGALCGLVCRAALASVLGKAATLEAKLARAVESGAIYLLYQPIVKGSTGQLVGFEALARWQDKELGQVRPDVFIPLAEEMGIAADLNRWIIERALRECATYLHANTSTYLSINLEIASLLDDSVTGFLLEQAQRQQIDTRQIVIEILEGTTAGLAQLQKAVARLHQQGFQLFIDDFGTGYSGLAYLGELRVDKIKIDRIFTQAAGTDSAAAMILQMIFKVAHDVGTGVVFEGVETPAQMAAILAICPEALAQGWLYSKAVPIGEMRTVFSC